MVRCPNYNWCSAPKCPLDINMSKRVQLPGDPKCTATKRTRLRIGKELPMKGLTPREYAAIIRTYGSLRAYKRAKFKNTVKKSFKSIKDIAKIQ